jgi:hypothetical protein
VVLHGNLELIPRQCFIIFCSISLVDRTWQSETWLTLLLDKPFCVESRHVQAEIHCLVSQFLMYQTTCDTVRTVSAPENGIKAISDIFELHPRIVLGQKAIKLQFGLDLGTVCHPSRVAGGVSGKMGVDE